MKKECESNFSTKTWHEVTEKKSMYSTTPSLTSALDGGAWLMRRLCRFTLWNDPVPILQEAGRAPELFYEFI